MGMVLMYCRVTPGMRAPEIRRRCVLMGLTDEKLNDYIETLVDAKLLLQIPEYEPFDTYLWVDIPGARSGESQRKQITTHHEPEPDTPEGKRHYHWVYRVPEEVA